MQHWSHNASLALVPDAFKVKRAGATADLKGMRAREASPLLRCAFLAIGLGLAFELSRAVADVGGSELNALADTWVYMGIEFVAIAVCIARVLTRSEQRLA